MVLASTRTCVLPAPVPVGIPESSYHHPRSGVPHPRSTRVRRIAPRHPPQTCAVVPHRSGSGCVRSPTRDPPTSDARSAARRGRDPDRSRTPRSRRGHGTSDPGDAVGRVDGRSDGGGRSVPGDSSGVAPAGRQRHRVDRAPRVLPLVHRHGTRGDAAGPDGDRRGGGGLGPVRRLGSRADRPSPVVVRAHAPARPVGHPGRDDRCQQHSARRSGPVRRWSEPPPLPRSRAPDRDLRGDRGVRGSGRRAPPPRRPHVRAPRDRGVPGPDLADGRRVRGELLPLLGRSRRGRHGHRRRGLDVAVRRMGRPGRRLATGHHQGVVPVGCPGRTSDRATHPGRAARSAT